MQKGLISVIVPIYNAEAFLDLCVQSILAQTYSDIEVILVNDGSTDKSGVLCDNFAKKDVRVKVIHQTNGGMNCARNAGLDSAQGEFIIFIDSDDTIDLNMYECLYEHITKSGADISICGYRSISDYQEQIKRVPPLYNKISSAELWDNYLKNPEYAFLFFMPVNKLIRKSSMQVSSKENEFRAVRFPEWLDSDGYFAVDCITVAKNGIIFVDEVFYNYLIYNNTNSLSDNYSYEKSKEFYSYLQEVLSSELPNRGSDIDRAIKKRLSADLVFHVHRSVINRAIIPHKLKWRNVSDVICSSASLSKKIASIMFFFKLYSLYRLVFRIFLMKQKAS